MSIKNHNILNANNVLKFLTIIFPAAAPFTPARATTPTSAASAANGFAPADESAVVFPAHALRGKCPAASAAAPPLLQRRRGVKVEN